MPDRALFSPVRSILLIFLGSLVLLGNAEEYVWNTLTGHRTVLLGHRGDPFWAPDHSKASYTIAIEEGLDYIEPDLQLTLDGVPVCSHDPYLSATTDIADHPEFADRKRNRETLHSRSLAKEDWWIVDFTLDELKTLRLKQGRPDPKQRNQIFNGMFPMLTFEEFLDFIEEMSENVNRTLGVVPEIKDSKFYSEDNVKKGRDEWFFEDAVLDILESHGYDLQRDYTDPELGHYLVPSTWKSHPGPVMIQSFEVDNLKYLKSQCTVPLVQLVAAERLGQIQDPEEMAEVATYAAVTSADLKYFFEDEDLISKLHSLGLGAVVYTLRNAREEKAVREKFDGDFRALFEWFYERGLDSAFSEKSFVGIAARDHFVERKESRSCDGSDEEDCADCTKLKVATGFLSGLILIIAGAFVLMVCRQRRRSRFGSSEPLQSGHASTEIDF